MSTTNFDTLVVADLQADSFDIGEYTVDPIVADEATIDDITALTIESGTIEATDSIETVDLTVTGTATIAGVTAISSASVQKTATARTATVAGATTGTVALGTSVVVVTSADANHIIILPDAPVGTEMWLINAGTGYEIRSNDPATVGINGGTGSAAESAIPANILVHLFKTTATNWVGDNKAANGAVTVTEVAAP